MTEPLTLASSSPRRRQLLEMLGIPVRVVAPNVPEVRRPVETPVNSEEATAFARLISEDPEAEAAFGQWILERGTDLAAIRVD